ncbi:hypothetical protein D3Z45_12565 [Lachnospiraceae bacterium]|nr:hypothetical protein [Lachnospiraceae bacterium]
MGTNLFDYLIILSGLYLVYTAVNMKQSGEVKNGVIVSKDVDVNRIRDKEGFIKYMYGRVLIIGGLAIAVGGVGILSTWLNWPGYLSLLATGGYLIVIICFAVASAKARKIFID